MTTDLENPTMPDPQHEHDVLLTLAEAAEVIRVPVATLRYWRHLGTGPRGFRVGRSVRYWRTEVLGWLEEQCHQPDRTQIQHD